ncbi:MAG: hypothetical protein H6742_10360 [Alphaproteobacteria bacterium]|nr:hypothetical protein [Alphaproteobacteria bacterium]
MLERLIQAARRPWIVLALGVGLVLPGLLTGFMVDDWFHRAVMFDVPGSVGEGTPAWRAMFTFMPGPHDNQRIVELGVMPWWAAPEVRAAFFRPLSSATHLLDFALWRDNAVLQHAHSIAWWAAGLVLVWGLYRRLLDDPRVAALAAVLFAVDDSHAMVIGWIANRNALLCLVFGVLAVWWHADRKPVRAFVAAAVGLCAGEAAVGAFAYLFAWELCQRDDALLRRFLRLVPYGLLLVALKGVYAAYGLGASGSGLYIDPGASPVAFLVALAERWPILGLAQVAGAPIDLWLFGSRTVQLTMSAVSMIVVVAVSAGMWRWLRGRPQVAFLAVGAALSAVPLCGAFPTDRLLMWPSVGAFGLLATAVVAVLGPVGGPEQKSNLVGALLFVHLPAAAFALPLRVLAVPLFADFFHAPALDLTRDVELEDQTLVFVNGMELTVAYTGLLREAANIVRDERGMDPMPVAENVCQLSGVLTGSTITRIDARTLQVEPDGGFLATPMDRMFWHPDHPFHAGQVVSVPAMSVDVLEVDDGRPSRVHMHFAEPLDGGGYRFVVLADGRWGEWTPPPVGESVRVEPGLYLPRWRITDAAGEVVLGE